MGPAAKTTSWAVLVGAGLGGLIASLGPGPVRPETGKPPFPPVAELGRTKTDAATPRDPPAAPLPAHTSISLPDAAPVAKPAAAALSLDCARGDPYACLDRADVADSLGDSETATLHRRLAVRRLVERCAERRGEDCARLAALYRNGSGVERNIETADALHDRAVVLCRGRPAPGCPKEASERVK